MISLPWMEKLRELIKTEKGQAKNILTELYKYGDEQEKELTKYWDEVKRRGQEWQNTTQQQKETKDKQHDAEQQKAE